MIQAWQKYSDLKVTYIFKLNVLCYYCVIMTPKLCCQYTKLNQRPVTVLCAYETEFSYVKLPLDIGKMFSHHAV